MCSFATNSHKLFNKKTYIGAEVIILKLGDGGEEKLIGHKAYNLNKAMTSAKVVVPSGMLLQLNYMTYCLTERV